MDNLKFTAEMVPVEIEGTSDEQKKQNYLVVQTYTRNSINYKMTVVNPDAVQFPEVFLTPKMAIESIIKHISQGPSYTYDERTDIIEIKYKMFDNYCICLQLKKNIANIPTLEQRITRLELLLDALTTEELIESHIYPTWSTYEEFMQLPGYKYFDAFHNAQRYFNSEPMVYLGKFRDIYYVPQTQSLSMASSDTSNAASKAACMAQLALYVKPVSILQKKEMEQTSKDVNFYSTMYKQPAQPQGEITTDNFRDYFQQSLKTFIYTQSNNANYYVCPVCPVIEEYLRMYIFGFYLLNHQILIGRDVRIEMHLLGDKMSLHIFRSKKIIMIHRNLFNESYSMQIPTITNIKVDGVYVRHFEL